MTNKTRRKFMSAMLTLILLTLFMLAVPLPTKADQLDFQTGFGGAVDSSPQAIFTGPVYSDGNKTPMNTAPTGIIKMYEGTDNSGTALTEGSGADNSHFTVTYDSSDYTFTIKFGAYLKAGQSYYAELQLSNIYDADGSALTATLGTTYGFNFTPSPAAVPTIMSESAYYIEATTATFGCALYPGDASTAVSFEYGTSTSYGSTVAAADGPFNGLNYCTTSSSLSGLIPNTTYHYRAVAVNSAGTAYGDDKTFQTEAKAPDVTTIDASDVSATTATLHGSVNANNSSTSVSFLYKSPLSSSLTVTAAESPVTGTSPTPVSYSLTGLTPSTTYTYRVQASNSAGSRNGSLLTFTTPSIAPTATTNDAGFVTDTSATLNGFVNPNNLSTDICFEYGTSTSYGNSGINYPSSLSTSSSSIHYNLTGLTPNTTYHFRVKAVSSAGTVCGDDKTFTTPAIVPDAVTKPASSVSSSSATLNGSVNAHNASSTVTFDYGTSESYGSTVTAAESPVTGMDSTNVSYSLTGLIPNTTYYFRVRAVNSAGTVDGENASFTTPAIAPTVKTNDASGVSAFAATLNGSVNANNASSSVFFNYGTSTQYEHTTSIEGSQVTGTSPTLVSYSLTGLIPNTTYHFRICAYNAAEQPFCETKCGDDKTFTTPAIDPTAVTKDASGVSYTTATLNGTVNANNSDSTVSFEYGMSTSYGNTVTASGNPFTGTSSKPVSIELTGLTPNSAYHYRLKAVNSAGTVYGDDKTFTTPIMEPTMTTGDAGSISTTTATLNGSVNANNSDSVANFIYGTSINYGMTADPAGIPVTGISATPVSCSLTGLTPYTTYHYRLVAYNSGGHGSGDDKTFITSGIAPTVTTQAVSGIGSTTATGNGNISDLGCPNPSAYGVCWNTAGSPTILDGKADNGTASSTGAFIASMTSLAPNTTYYVRAFASNAAGTSYGDTVSFKTQIAVIGGEVKPNEATVEGSGISGTSIPVTIDTKTGSAALDIGTLPKSALSGHGNTAITVPVISGVNSYSLGIPTDYLSVSGGKDMLMANTATGSISIPSGMLANTAAANGKQVQISIAQGDKSGLTDAEKTAIGNRPLIQLSMTIDGQQTEWSNPGAPVTVSIPYTPTAEELKNPEAIVIWYIDGSGNAVSIPNGHYDAATGKVTFTTTHFSQYAVGFNKVGFSDTADSAWYGSFVNYLAARNIIGGIGGGQFGPDAAITRAQFAAILAKASGDSLCGYTSSAFSDVSAEDWYFAAAQWANKNGIAVGSDGKFDPNASITREQMAAMLYRYAKYVGADVSNVEGMSVREFSDYGSISSWALEAIQWSVNNKIVSGNGDGCFTPQESATRAQAAKMIAVLMQGIAK